MEQGSASQSPQETPQHSPGPWRLDKAVSGQRIVRDALDLPVASLPKPELDFDEPNARLIEQAPRTLEALKAATEQLAEVLSDLGTLSEIDPTELAAFRAQIAAAEGRDAS